jgi:hypothetical protein
MEPNMYSQMFPTQQQVILMENPTQPQIDFNQSQKQETKVRIPELVLPAVESPQYKLEKPQFNPKDLIDEGSISTKASEEYKSESEDSISVSSNEKVKIFENTENKKRRSPISKPKQNTLFFSPVFPSKKDGERRKNRWQAEQEAKELEKINEKVRLINETEVNHAEQKIVDTPMGERHQVQVPAFVFTERTSRRQLKAVWNPESLPVHGAENILEKLQEKLKIEIDEEKAIKLLNENNGNVEEVLKLVDAEEKKYLGYFSLRVHKKKTVL